MHTNEFKKASPCTTKKLFAQKILLNEIREETENKFPCAREKKGCEKKKFIILKRHEISTIWNLKSHFHS